MREGRGTYVVKSYKRDKKGCLDPSMYVYIYIKDFLYLSWYDMNERKKRLVTVSFVGTRFYRLQTSIHYN